MDTPIRMPFMERRLDNLHIQKGPQPNHASTTFGARSFVYLSSGVLVPCATAATACFGQAPGPSHLATELPPATLYGIYHWVFNPADAQFVVNITDASGHIGVANGAPQLSEVVIGTSYNLYRDSNGFQMLNVDTTAQPFFKVLSIYPNQALTDYNGLVLVEIVKSIIQA
jgi:hypothetical protein